MQALTFIELFNRYKDLELISSIIEFKFSSSNEPLASYLKAVEFFNKKFKATDVPKYFKNWSLVYDDSIFKKGIILTNDHSNGKWITKLTINDGGEYTFHSPSKSPIESHQWQYLPKTMDEFISDCLRYEDVDLIFSEEAIQEIFKN